MAPLPAGLCWMSAAAVDGKVGGTTGGRAGIATGGEEERRREGMMAPRASGEARSRDGDELDGWDGWTTDSRALREASTVLAELRACPHSAGESLENDGCLVTIRASSLALPASETTLCSER